MSKTIVFGDARPTEVVKLPSYKGSEVEIIKGMTVGQQRKLMKEFPNASDSKHEDSFLLTVKVLKDAIKNWNFTDSDQKPLEKTAEVFDEFVMGDLFLLVEKAMGKKIIKGSEEDKAEKKS